MADEQSEIADVCVTLCVNAGVAASDVICCARPGEYPHGEDHNEAVEVSPLHLLLPGRCPDGMGRDAARKGTDWCGCVKWSPATLAPTSGCAATRP